MNKIIYQDEIETIFLIKSPKLGNIEVLIDTEDWGRISKILWYISTSKNKSYYYVYSNKYKCRLHRFIMNIHDSNIFIDHKDHNTLNNKKSNLRICNNLQNSWNRKINIYNTSGYTGVYWNKFKNKWQAQIRNDNKYIFLGLFKDKIEAAIAYNNKAKELRGEFAYLNKIE